MSLEKIPGNSWAKKIIGEAIENRDFLHNYLFLGSDMDSMVKAGQIMAQAILCNNTSPNLEACPSCQNFFQGSRPGENHPDYWEIFPTKSTSKESIKKSAVEEIIASSAMKSYEGKNKVYLIHNFETMTAEGQNALLKTLEEPLSGIHFILLAKSRENILPTVLSRSNILVFDGLLEEDVYEILSKEGYNKEAVDRLISYASGSYTMALALGQDGAINALRDQVFQTIYKVIKQPGYSAMASWEFFSEHLEDFDTIFFFLESWARDIMVYYTSGSLEKVANKDYGHLIEEERAIMGKRCPRMMDILLRAKEYLHNNGNKQLVIESMLLEIGG